MLIGMDLTEPFFLPLLQCVYPLSIRDAKNDLKITNNLNSGGQKN